MLAISEQQLRGWQRKGFIPAADTFSFSDLIALRALQKLRENRIPSKQIGRAPQAKPSRTGNSNPSPRRIPETYRHRLYNPASSSSEIPV